MSVSSAARSATSSPRRASSHTTSTTASRAVSSAAVDPEVAIFMVGTNDAAIWSSRDADEYHALATEMMDILSDGGRRLVVWIGTPTLGRDTWNESAVEINRIVSELAAERPEVLFVDAFDVFDDGAGGYTESLPDLDGETVRMRNGDGTHLTEAGGEHLAAIVFALIDDIWNIAEQADPDNPIAWTSASASGCDGDCGYSGDSEDDYVDDGSDGGVVTEEPPPEPVATTVATPSTAAPPTTASSTTAPSTTAPTTVATTTPTTASTPEPPADSTP
jgi:lysophospholipase L1-like esterase